MRKHLPIIVLVVGICLILAGVATAAYYVYSNVEHVDVAPKTIALAVTTNGLEVTFTASGVDPSASVAFGTSTATPATDGSFTILHTSVADGSGVATWTYTTEQGSYDYAARALNTEIP